MGCNEGGSTNEEREREMEMYERKKKRRGMRTLGCWTFVYIQERPESHCRNERAHNGQVHQRMRLCVLTCLCISHFYNCVCLGCVWVREDRKHGSLCQCARIPSHRKPPTPPLCQQLPPSPTHPPRASPPLLQRSLVRVHVTGHVQVSTALHKYITWGRAHRVSGKNFHLAFQNRIR